MRSEGSKLLDLNSLLSFLESWLDLNNLLSLLESFLSTDGDESSKLYCVRLERPLKFLRVVSERR